MHNPNLFMVDNETSGKLEYCLLNLVLKHLALSSSSFLNYHSLLSTFWKLTIAALVLWGDLQLCEKH